MAQQRKRAQQTESDGRNNRVFQIAIGILVLGGVGWLVLAGRGGGATGPLPTPAEFEALSAGITADPSVGITLGSESAPVEIVEFADYSCPHCATFSGFAGKLLRQNYVETGDIESGGGPLRWVLYDYVLGGFPNSLPAAMAARCAGEQDRYWPMHDLIFSRQTRWDFSASPGGELAEIAGDIGLEMGAYRECMNESRYLEQVAASRKYGDSRGVQSTPTIFLDGVLLNLAGKEPYSYIEGLILAKLGALSASSDEAAADSGAGEP